MVLSSLTTRQVRSLSFLPPSLSHSVPPFQTHLPFPPSFFLPPTPTAVALNEVRTLYPGVPVECVVSIGTGVHVDKRKSDGGYGWEGIVNDLINCATNTEVTHETLSVFLPKSKYYRFNPQTEFFPLDETKPERLARMKRIAREYFWQSENKERMNQLVQLLKKGASPLPHLRSSLRP